MHELQTYFLSLPPAMQAVLAALVVFSLVDSIVLLSVHLRAACQPCRRADRVEDLPTISVIIVLRERFEEFKEHLPLFLGQDYPYFDLVIVNTTGDAQVEMELEQLRKRHERIHLCPLPPDDKFMPKRKYPLALGLRAAKGEWVVHTSSRSYPSSEQWLSLLAQHFTLGSNFALGFGGLARGRSLANAYARAELRWSTLTRAGFALSGAFLIGQRRNFAHRKSVFFNGLGFKGYNHIPGGDDDLFTLQNARRRTTSVVLSPRAQTQRPPIEDWAEWRRHQRIDRSSWPMYPVRVKLLLQLEAGLRYAIWILSTLLLLEPEPLCHVGLAALGLRILLLNLALIVSMAHLRMGGSLLWAWVYDLVGPLVNIAANLRSYRKKTHNAWR